MATQAFTGKGAELYYGDLDTPTNFVKVVQVASIGALNSESPTIDATDLDSEEDEFIGGNRTPQDTQCVLNWLPTHATHINIRNDGVAGTKRYWRIVWKKNAVTIESATFQAVVRAGGPGETTNKSVQQFPFTLQRSGGITWLN
jgi:hypothetical protein